LASEAPFSASTVGEPATRSASLEGAASLERSASLEGAASLDAVEAEGMVDTDWASELLPDGPPPPPPDAEPGVHVHLAPPGDGPVTAPVADGIGDIIDTDWASELLPDGPPPPPDGALL